MDRPDLEIVYRDPASLTPWIKNARTHSDDQVRLIRASINEYGFANPILLKDDGVTIGAGHARQAASLLDPPLAQVPTITLNGLTEEQWRAYVLADNQLAINGSGWDLDILRAELLDLKGGGFDLSLTGFASEELSALFKAPNGPRGNPDFVPPPPQTPISLLGDIWLLGKHRLICGDCTDAATVAKALDGHKPHLMVTDPPYGVNYDPNWRNGKIGGNTSRTGVVDNDERAEWREAWALFPGDVAYIWHGGKQAGIVESGLAQSKFEIRSQIIWVKQSSIIGRGDYHWQHEACWYAVRKGATGHWEGGRKQRTVWEIANLNQDAKTVHGTQKPIECMKRPIENNSKPGDRVYEPFSGSGTTLIAAQMTKRVCHAIELNPVYIDVAVDRWEGFTGDQARLEATGQTFAEVRAERAPQGAT